MIRGGTTSVGLAAAGIAKANGAHVVSTTRQPPGRQFDKVLELVGTTTLVDSLHCCREGGLVCMAGMVGNRWSFDSFSPMDVIPTGVGLTTYSGDVEDFMSMPLDDLVRKVAAGSLRVQIGRTFHPRRDRGGTSLDGREPGRRQDRRVDVTAGPVGASALRRAQRAHDSQPSVAAREKAPG